MKISIGIEGTYAPHSGKDTLAITRHYEAAQWKQDLTIVHGLGIEQFRYPIPWHRIETSPGRYDWRHLDEFIPVATERFGLSIIADPLHHTSYPGWLSNGFANPHFARRYKQFVGEFARRYPQVTHYTPFNEPSCTLDFCGYRGFWHPYYKGDRTYVEMLRNTARATAEVIHELRQLNPGVHILHVDTFERHDVLDEASLQRAEFLNERRFLFEELIQGKVDRQHSLYRYLRRNGFGNRDLEWHLEHPARIDERGGNYYPLNEEQLLRGATFYAPSRRPAGLAAVVQEYAARVKAPLSFTETNIQGTVRDRISWLKYTLEQAEALARRGIRFRSFAWYPLFDCAGWNSLLQHKRWKRDPQGIVSCGPNWRREATELTDIYAKVVGGAGSDKIPAYLFSGRHDRTLSALQQQMQWRWQEQ
jgi:beta-glucosidase/6-phospho-beta-glucosidase/beta-galactosidase